MTEMAAALTRFVWSMRLQYSGEVLAALLQNTKSSTVESKSITHSMNFTYALSLASFFHFRSDVRSCHKATINAPNKPATAGITSNHHGVLSTIVSAEITISRG